MERAYFYRAATTAGTHGTTLRWHRHSTSRMREHHVKRHLAFLWGIYFRNKARLNVERTVRRINGRPDSYYYWDSAQATRVTN